MKKTIRITLVLIFGALVFFAFRPISFSENPKMYRGKIVTVFEGGIKDAVFELQNNKSTFYINRGFEDFDAQKLESLVGQTVVIYYSDGWTPLDPFNNRSKTIEKLEVANSLFYQQ